MMQARAFGAAVAASDIVAARGFTRRMRPLQLAAQGVRMVAALLPELPVQPDAPWLRFTLNGMDGAVQVSWGALRRLTGLPIEAAQPADAVLLVEEALTPWLDEAEATLNLTLRLTGIGTGGPPDLPSAARLALAVQGLSPHGARVTQASALHLSPDAAFVLARALAPLQVPRADADMDGLVLPAAIERDALSLPLAEVRALRPGDALYLPPDAPAARLVVAGSLSAPVSLETDDHSGRWRLDAPLRPLSSDNTEVSMSSEDQSNAPPDGAAPAAAGQHPAETASIDDLDIRLTLRAGETLISLAELRRLGPGAVVHLNQPGGAEVEILANGRLIGRGEVISVAGQRAVEIRSLFGET